MFNNKASIVMSIAAVSFIAATGVGYAAEKGVVTADSLNIRSGPSTSYSIKAKVSKGTVVNIGKKSNGWYEVSLANGVTGWASGAYISIQENSSNTVSSGQILDATYLRKTASWSAEKGELLSKGAVVEVLSKDVNWTKVKYNGNIGYVSNDYIKVTVNSSDSATNSGSSVNTGELLESVYLRDSASWSANKGEIISKGTKVEVISKDTNWTKVKYNGNIGYVSNDHIKVTLAQGGGSSSDNTQSKPSVEEKVGEIIDATYLRKTASWSAEKGVLLSKGTKVNIISSDDNWTKVNYNGSIGYISNDYIKISTVVQGCNSNNNGSVNKPSIGKGKILVATYLRDKDSWAANKLVVLQPGTEVDVISKGLDWTKVKYNGIEGYIGNDYIDVNLGETVSQDRDKKIQAIVKLAKEQLGKPYEWGAEGPNSFDCSGLLYYVYKEAAGVILPRTSREQAKVGTAVKFEDMKPGDLIAFDESKNGTINHIGMYVGDGQFIHSLKAGKPVQLTSTSSSYWKNVIAAIRRVL